MEKKIDVFVLFEKQRFIDYLNSKSKLEKYILIWFFCFCRIPVSNAIIYYHKMYLLLNFYLISPSVRQIINLIT